MRPWSSSLGLPPKCGEQRGELGGGVCPVASSSARQQDAGCRTGGVGVPWGRCAVPGGRQAAGLGRAERGTTWHSVAPGAWQGPAPPGLAPAAVVLGRGLAGGLGGYPDHPPSAPAQILGWLAQLHPGLIPLPPGPLPHLIPSHPIPIPSDRSPSPIPARPHSRGVPGAGSGGAAGPGGSREAERRGMRARGGGDEGPGGVYGAGGGCTGPEGCGGPGEGGCGAGGGVRGRGGAMPGGDAVPGGGGMRGRGGGAGPLRGCPRPWLLPRPLGSSSPAPPRRARRYLTWAGAGSRQRRARHGPDLSPGPRPGTAGTPRDPPPPGDPAPSQPRAAGRDGGQRGGGVGGAGAEPSPEPFSSPRSPGAAVPARPRHESPGAGCAGLHQLGAVSAGAARLPAPARRPLAQAQVSRDPPPPARTPAWGASQHPLLDPCPGQLCAPPCPHPCAGAGRGALHGVALGTPACPPARDTALHPPTGPAPVPRGGLRAHHSALPEAPAPASARQPVSVCPAGHPPQPWPPQLPGGLGRAQPGSKSSVSCCPLSPQREGTHSLIPKPLVLVAGCGQVPPGGDHTVPWRVGADGDCMEGGGLGGLLGTVSCRDPNPVFAVCPVPVPAVPVGTRGDEVVGAG